MIDKPRPPAMSKPIELDHPVFFSATPSPAASEETHYLAPNPEFDRPGSNRLAGFGESLPFFTQCITGVREGYENAMRLLAMSSNALCEADVEQRWAALKEALDLMESVKDDQSAADVIAMQKGLLLGSMAGTLMARRQGDPVQNRSDAIDYYQRAMQHFIAQKDNENIVKTKYNLADAYAAGIGSDDRSDGKLALSYLREVIAEASPTADVLLGRVVRLNFAGLVRRFAQDSGGASMIDEAIGYVNEVTAAVSKEEDRSLWSSAMNTLGGLYAKRQSGDRRSNLQQAILYFEQSLEGRPKDMVPDQWNATTNNLLAVKRVYAQEFEPERVDESFRDYLAQREPRIAELTKQGRLLLAADEKVFWRGKDMRRVWTLWIVVLGKLSLPALMGV